MAQHEVRSGVRGELTSASCLPSSLVTFLSVPLSHLLPTSISTGGYSLSEAWEGGERGRGEGGRDGGRGRRGGGRDGGER